MYGGHKETYVPSPYFTQVYCRTGIGRDCWTGEAFNCRRQYVITLLCKTEIQGSGSCVSSCCVSASKALKRYKLSKHSCLYLCVEPALSLRNRLFLCLP